MALVHSWTEPLAPATARVVAAGVRWIEARGRAVRVRGDDGVERFRKP